VNSDETKSQREAPGVASHLSWPRNHAIYVTLGMDQYCNCWPAVLPQGVSDFLVCFPWQNDFVRYNLSLPSVGKIQAAKSMRSQAELRDLVLPLVAKIPPRVYQDTPGREIRHQMSDQCCPWWRNSLLKVLFLL